MLIIKLQFGTDLRRIAVESAPNFASLLQLVKNIFSDVNLGSFALKYYDDEGDVISVDSDIELNEAVRQLSSGSLPVLRLVVVTETNPLSQKAPSDVPPVSLLTINEEEINRQLEELARNINETSVPVTPIEKESLIKRIERQLEQAIKKLSEYVENLGLKNKFTEVVTVCHRQILVASDKANLNVFKPFSVIAAKQAKEFQNDIQKLTNEINRLKQELKVELQKKAELHQDRKDKGKAYFPPFLAFKSFSSPISEKKEEKIDVPKEEEVPKYPNLEEVVQSESDISETEMNEIIKKFEVLERYEGEALKHQEYSEELNAMQQMGFVNRDLNLVLLVKFNGDVSRVVEDLINV